jgi:hypothetical protein
MDGYVENRDTTHEILYYSQSRVIGLIHDIVSYPPSLLLHDATVFTINLVPEHQENRVVYNEPQKLDHKLRWIKL